MSILVIGCHGSMGRRYQAILSYLGKPFRGVDLEHNRHYARKLAEESDGIILATPTKTHVELIREYLPLQKPILCEKPVCKDVAELKGLMAEIKDAKTPFRMMYQYQILADSSRIGKTHYNYFRHGSDGLAWDCLQIVGLARGECRLKESSPVWSCMINGKRLSIEHMDAAYVAYVQRWLQAPKQDPCEIIAAHEKTAMAAEQIDGAPEGQVQH